ncbi:RNA 2',3'-cyclic phosphodiesterase [Sedimentisphaera salicampi]|uniref:RNA 2',3'-cyclic phosphodiesterase n=1 Tax=Sedimentisphaera salicampi TaxID=1941349 RepID=UPI000B9BEFA5|nr:RNA 2',3'-cyclic phosphodiesterase [Sedimentisphaera salicampi]OXU15140.1 2'-5' RNA ligase [Sedimentisphaera salicampi]
MRTFVAVVPYPEVLDKIDRVQKRIAPELGNFRRDIKWVKPEDAHITLAFLGEVADNNLQSVCDIVRNSVTGRADFTMSLRGTGTFGKNAHTFWAGVTKGAEELKALREAVCRPLAEKGFFSPSKRFEPHITLARIKSPRPARIIKSIDRSLKKQSFGSCPVESVCVFTSELTKKGPEYTLAAQYFFAGPQ